MKSTTKTSSTAFTAFAKQQLDAKQQATIKGGTGNNTEFIITEDILDN